VADQTYADVELLYQRVAKGFVQALSGLFESEESLKSYFMYYLGHLEFDRTNHWGGLVYKLFRDSWLECGPEVKTEPTGYDRSVILKMLSGMLDYNVFTQVYLNLQTLFPMAYQSLDAENDIKKLQEAWKNAKVSPFTPKARMFKEASNDEEKKFNLALSTLKSLKIIAGFTPQISFRVSPRGSTPALADSNNISTLGVGADKYLRVMPGLKPFYIHWAPGTAPLWAVPSRESLTDEPGGFRVNGITDYLFHSKSGGEVLNDVMFARWVAFQVFRHHDILTETCILIPRMYSTLVVAEEFGKHVKEAFAEMKQLHPCLEFSEGTRA